TETRRPKAATRTCRAFVRRVFVQRGRRRRPRGQDDCLSVQLRGLYVGFSGDRDGTIEFSSTDEKGSLRDWFVAKTLESVAKMSLSDSTSRLAQDRTVSKAPVAVSLHAQG